MSDGQKDANGSPAMVLPKVLDISAAGMLKASLVGLMADGADVDLDAGSVQRLTTPCLQVFVAAAKSLRQRGGALHFVNVPDEFRDMVQTLGLGEMLSLTEA